MRGVVRLCCIASAIICLMTAGRAQWVQTGGPEGGAVGDLKFDGSVLLAGMYGNGGVYVSTDAGQSWTQKIEGMGYQSVSTICKSGSVLLASGTVGVYRSLDGGESWTAATGLPSANGVTKLLIDGTTLYAGTSGKGVYVSTDDGATWTDANTNLPASSGYTYVGGMAVAASGVVAAVTDNSTYGVFRTTNNGTTWTRIDVDLPPWTQLSDLQLDGSVMYGTGSDLLKSTDDGIHWVVAGSGIPSYSGVNRILIHNSTIFVGASSGIFRSTDGGANFSMLGGGLPLMMVASLAASGSTIVAGTIANGVYSSTDNGDTWTQTVSGLHARDMNGFLSDGTRLYGNGNGIFSTDDAGNTWSIVRGNLKDSSAQPTLLYVDGSTMFCRDFPANGIERSTDGGATWVLCGGGLPPFGTVQAMTSSGGALLAVSGRIYRSTDNGDSWVQVDSALGLFANFSNLTRIGTSVFAHGMGLARSTDDGITWTTVGNGIPQFFTINSITTVGGTLIAGGGYPPANYRSTDNGDSWTAIATLPSFSVATQFVAQGNTLFACGENNGIFLSTNSGTNWTSISAGLPSPNYRYTLAIHNGMMFAGTSGNSVWKRPLSDVSAVRVTNDLVPLRHSLHQNYPNPFNPSTDIRFDIMEAGMVSLEIVDLLGRRVAVLLEEHLSPGSYSVTWNAAEVPTGTYFARLTSRTFQQTVKMQLMK